MKLKNFDKDIKSYKKIILVTPIWVFSLCTPIREFCYKYANDINDTEYIITHFMNCKFGSVADEMDKIINIRRKKITSICVRLGKVKKYEVMK